jgi:chemotaxis protein methyltransferase CheR
MTSGATILPATATAQLSDAQLRRFADLIYRRSGISLSSRKRLMLTNRLRRRLQATGIADFDRYYRRLRGLEPADAEWDAFLQEVATHETYLFRDAQQWDWFRNEYLPRLSAAARAGRAPRTLRVWSAACSSGDEPVTAACCIAAAIKDLPAWRVRILGTDLSGESLRKAKAAVFGARAMRLVPTDMRRRFFAPTADGKHWQALPAVTDMISYRRHNLLDPPAWGLFDLVLLRNVMIYFDAASKATVIANVRRAVRPGGYLLCGAVEGVSAWLRDFTRSRPWLFQNPSPSPERTRQ